jgi:hypothetical protein
MAETKHRIFTTSVAKQRSWSSHSASYAEK